jgi:hypothetical protein
VLPDLVLDEEAWVLQRSLRFHSHRRWLGRLVVAAKRRLVLPLVRWLYEFSRDNFVRQHEVNQSLLACVETLVFEVVRLRREVAALRAPAATGAPGEPR